LDCNGSLYPKIKKFREKREEIISLYDLCSAVTQYASTRNAETISLWYEKMNIPVSIHEIDDNWIINFYSKRRSAKIFNLIQVEIPGSFKDVLAKNY